MTARNMKTMACGIAAFLAITACEDKSGQREEEVAGNRACAFAEAYYNQYFDKAMEMVTPESQKWITFYVSNLTEDDLKVLEQHPTASKAMLNELALTSDSTATARLTIDSVYVADSIGKPGCMESNKELTLQLVKRGKQWLVCLQH